MYLTNVKARGYLVKEMLAQISPLPWPEPSAVRLPHLGGPGAPTAVEEPGAGRDQVRLSGDLFRAMGDLLLRRRPGSSRGAVAHELQRRLAACGIHYHVRTLKRQLTGQVRSVLARVESVMAQVLAESLGLSTVDDVREAFAAAGLGPGDSRPVYVPVKEVVDLASLWLYLNPDRSRRFLARRLQVRLRKAGAPFTVDSLQAILARTKLTTRRAVYDELVGLLVESGVASETEALARCRASSAEIAHAARGRDLVHATRFHELCELWRAGRREPSFRRLCLRLKQRLDERRIRLSLPHLQAIASGRARAVRRCVLQALEEVVRAELPLGHEVEAHGPWPGSAVGDLRWIDARRVVDLAQEWLALHPGATRRQLALRLARAVHQMGYSMSHNSIQPLLGGWKKKARGFVYRAVRAELWHHEGPPVVPARCRTRGCVFPAARDGLCHRCCRSARDARPFARRSTGADCA